VSFARFIDRLDRVLKLYLKLKAYLNSTSYDVEVVKNLEEPVFA
jgi:hypothetical protein